MRFSLTRDTITPELARLQREVKRPIVLYQAGAKAVQVQLSKHMKRLQARGNQMGWPSKHFFAGSADSVEKRIGIAKISDTGAEITIADPRFVHRLTGGTVTPKRRQFLAIPLRADAYALSGKGSLRESAPGLKVWKFKRGLFLVKEVEESRGAKSGRGRDASTGRFTAGTGGVKRIRVLPMFKLVKSVTHRPKPEEMPPTAELATAARNAMLTAARLLLRSN